MPRFNIVLEPINETQRKLFYQLSAKVLENTKSFCTHYCLKEGTSEPHISVVQIEIIGEYTHNIEILIQNKISEAINTLLRDENSKEFQQALLLLSGDGVRTTYNKHHFGNAKYYENGHAVELSVDLASKEVLRKIQDSIYVAVTKVLIPCLSEKIPGINITVANGIGDSYRPHFTLECYKRNEANNTDVQDESMSVKEGTPSQINITAPVNLGLGIHISGSMWESMERLFKFSLESKMLEPVTRLQTEGLPFVGDKLILPQFRQQTTSAATDGQVEHSTRLLQQGSGSSLQSPGREEPWQPRP